MFAPPLAQVSDTLNISVCILEEVFRNNSWEDFRWLMKIRAVEKRWIKQDWPLKVVNRLVRRGWLVCHRDRVYLVRMDAIFPRAGRHHTAKVPMAFLDDPGLFKTYLFYIGMCRLMAPQKRITSSSRKGARKYPSPSNASVHHGGISLSLCKAFFGMSIAWCSKMRSACRDRGWCDLVERWVVPLNKHGVVPHWIVEMAMEGRGRYSVYQGMVQEQVASLFVPVYDVRLHIPWEFRWEVAQFKRKRAS